MADLKRDNMGFVQKEGVWSITSCVNGYYPETVVETYYLQPQEGGLYRVVRERARQSAGKTTEVCGLYSLYDAKSIALYWVDRSRLAYYEKIGRPQAYEKEFNAMPFEKRAYIENGALLAGGVR